MRSLVRYAWFVVVYNVGVIVFGAFVRATGSGAGCGRSWPTCQPAATPGEETERLIELTHRLTAGLAVIAVVVLLVWVWKQTDQGHPARLGAVISLVAIVGEALIGAMIVLAEWVAHDDSVARTIAVPLHLVNTLFLLAALTLTIHWLRGGGRLDLKANRTVTRAVLLGGVALVLLSASGAVTALADTLFPSGAGADFAGEGHFLTRLRIVHPILAVTAAIIGWWAASRSGAGRSREGRVIIILVALMFVTGGANIALGVPVWMGLIHLALADALWITYVLVAAGALQASATTAPRLSPSR